MVFKRGKTLSTWQRLSNFMWPKTGFARAWTYITKRVQRLSDTPHRIALGFACGAFASFTPFFGLHFVIAGIFAHLLRGNIIAALSGTIVGNPLTFPLIAGSAMSTGSFLLGRLKQGGADATNVVADTLEIAGAVWNACLGALGFGDGTSLTWAEAWALLGRFAHDILLPYTLGGAVLGAVAAVIAFFLMRPLVSAYRERRRLRFQRARCIPGIA